MASLLEILEDGELSIFKTFLDETPTPELKNMLAKVDKDGNTPLHVLCAKGLVEEVVKVLNTEAASLEQRNNKGQTPLAVAAEKLQSEIVCLLIASGADSADVDQHGLEIFGQITEGASKHQLITFFPSVAQLRNFRIKPPPLVFIKFAEPEGGSKSSAHPQKMNRERSFGGKKSSRKRDKVITNIMYWETTPSDEDLTHEEESVTASKTPRGFLWLQTTPPGIGNESGAGDAPTPSTPARGLMLGTRARSRSKSGEDEINPLSQSAATPTFSEDNMESWPKLKFLPWLKQNNLEFLKPLYIQKSASSHDLTASTKIEKKDPLAFDANAPARFMENPEKRNHILLSTAPLAQILDYLVLDEKSPIFTIWDRDSFVNDFINLYPNFTDAKTVFEFMRSQFEAQKEPGSPHDGAPAEALRASFKRAAKPEDSLQALNKKKRILAFMEKWITKDNAQDFTSDPRLEADVNHFLSGVCSDPQLKEYRHLKSLISNLKKQQEGYFTQTPDDFPMKSLYDCSPLKLAAFITESMETMMDRVRTVEFLKQACHNPKYKHLAPNLFILFHFIEGFSNWINYEILHRTDSMDRIKALIFFLETTTHLRELNNFGGVAIIVSTLSASHFAKLKKDWSHVPANLTTKFQEWTNLISNVGKFKLYKEALTALPQGAKWFPILQIAVGDIAKIDEVTGDFVDDPKGWINWNKASIVNKLIASVKIPGRTRYGLTPYPSIKAFIDSREKWGNPNANYNIAVLHENDTEASSFSLWDPFTGDDLQKLKAIAGEHKKYQDGDAIIAASTPNKTLFFLISGSVVIKRGLTTKHGVNLLSIGAVKENSMFGEVSTFLYGKQQAQAPNIGFYAKGPVEALAIDLDQISGELLTEKTQIISLQRPEFRRLLRAMAVKVATDLIEDKGSEKVKAHHDLKATLSAELPVVEEKSPLQAEFDISEPVIREVACQHGKSTAGTLYISTNFICFLGRSFGLTKRIKHAIGDVNVSSKKRRHIQIGDDSFSQIREDVKELVNFIHTLQTKKSPRTGPSNRNLPRGISKKVIVELTNLQLSDDNWALILKGAQTHHFKAGQTLIDSSNRRLHQVVSGEIHIVETQSSGEDKVICSLKAPVKIGTIDFLSQDSRPNIKIVAKDDVSMTTICPYYLDMLFSYRPAVAAQFLFYLGTELAEKSTAKVKPPIFV